jgi:serine/threonine protein kinase
VIVGTPAYMSPEQARGQAVDRRTDVWAFGCVLFNMLTGRRPFGGETLTDTIAAVLTKEPDWTALPSTVPSNVTRLLQRCLEKDLRRRLRDIGDARLEIEDALAAAVREDRPNNRGVSRRTVIGTLVGAAAGAAGVGVFTFGRGRNAGGRDVMRFPIALPPGFH